MERTGEGRQMEAGELVIAKTRRTPATSTEKEKRQGHPHDQGLNKGKERLLGTAERQVGFGGKKGCPWFGPTFPQTTQLKRKHRSEPQNQFQSRKKNRGVYTVATEGKSRANLAGFARIKERQGKRIGTDNLKSSSCKGMKKKVSTTGSKAAM